MALYNSSLQLVAEANRLLDEIGEAGILREENVEKIARIRGEMLKFGFDAPFGGVLAATAREMGEHGEREAVEQKKQSSYLKYIAKLKKFTLNRIRAAHAAHLMALRMGGRELEAHFPLGGDYLKQLVRGGEHAINSYKAMMDAFSEYGSYADEVLASIEYFEGGEKKADSLRISHAGNLEARVKRVYGNEARVVGKTVVKGKASIIKNKSTKVALSCAIACFAGKGIAGMLAEKEEGELKQYNEILKKNGITPNSRLDLADGLLKVKMIVSGAGLGRVGTDGALELNEGLVHDINARRTSGEMLARKKSIQKLAECIFKAYIITNEQQRKSQSPIPSITAMPNELQLEIVDAGGGIGGVEKPSELLAKKLACEKESHGMEPRAFGMGFACLEGMDALECMKLFCASREEVEGAKLKVGGMLSGRGEKFLRELGKEKK